MKIVAISDVHNQISKVKVPECDLLLIAGDLTSKGTLKEIEKFNSDLLPIKNVAKKIVIIAGNHDFGFEEQSEKASPWQTITGKVGTNIF